MEVSHYINSQKSKIDGLRLSHDMFFEETFKMPSLGAAFLKKFLPPEILEWIDIEKLTVEIMKFRDELFRETRPDVVYRVPIIGTEECISFHVIVEHKSYDDPSAIYQIWKYVNQLSILDVKTRLTDPETGKTGKWPEGFRLSPVIPMILHHGDTPFTGETKLENLFYPIPGTERFLPRLEAVLVDLSMIEDENLPRDPNAPELYVVLLIMKTIFSESRMTIRRKISEILGELKPYSQVPMYRDLIYKLRYYVIWNAKNMTETDSYEIGNEIRETIEEGEDDMTTIAQIFINQGMEKGMEQGMEKGEVIRETKAILRILTRRFHTIPTPLEARISAITNLERLEELADFAFDCESLDEFAESVEK